MGIIGILINTVGNIVGWILQLLFGARPPTESPALEKNDDKPREGAAWLEKKVKYLSMPLSEKREHYKCGSNYVTLHDVLPWPHYWKENEEWLRKMAKGRLTDLCKLDPELNNKVSIWRGDITTLEIDIIVNAANKTLLGGGGVDGAIHNAAGETLVDECESLKGCETGDAKVTGGYLLPAKYVIHTVGPVGSDDALLRSCYQRSLDIMKEMGQKTIAFPCISTGVYGFPNERAANIGLQTTRTFLEKNGDQVERIIFCLFLGEDVEIYERLMQKYFPVCLQDELTDVQVPSDQPLEASQSEAAPSGEEVPTVTAVAKTIQEHKEVGSSSEPESKSHPEKPPVEELSTRQEDKDMPEVTSAGSEEHAKDAELDAKSEVVAETEKQDEAKKLEESLKEESAADELHAEKELAAVTSEQLASDNETNADNSKVSDEAMKTQQAEERVGENHGEVAPTNQEADTAGKSQQKSSEALVEDKPQPEQVAAAVAGMEDQKSEEKKQISAKHEEESMPQEQHAEEGGPEMAVNKAGRDDAVELGTEERSDTSADRKDDDQHIKLDKNENRPSDASMKETTGVSKISESKI